MNMILDYSQNFLNVREFKAKIIDNDKRSEKEFKRKKLNFDNVIKNQLLYNIHISECPFCKTKMEYIHSSYGSFQEEYYYSGSDNLDFFYCLKCGYWSVEMDYEKYDYEDEFTNYTKKKIEYRAILKEFEPKNNSIPIEILQIEIKKNPKLLNEISPTKMEDLVCQVFKSYFNCEVIHCGKSHDGGIDLMIIDCDDPILVQIKRRENSNISEPVKLIRELLGAMFIKSSKRGIFVTTANKFSVQSEKVRNEMLKTNKLDYFELIDFNRFSDILNLTTKTMTKPWNNIFLDYMNSDRRRLIHKHEYFDHYFPNQ